MKRKVGLKLLSLIGLLLSSCSLFERSVKSVSITNKIEELSTGEKYQLEVDVSPSKAQNKEVTWTSSDENVARITSNGLLTTFSVGSTTIEAISKQNSEIKDTFNLKVVKPVVTSIAVENLPTKTDYAVDETFNPKGLIIRATYSNSSTKSISYLGNENQFAFSIELDRPLTLSDNLVEVTYKEKTTSFEISVSEITVLDKTKLLYTYDDYMSHNAYSLDNCPLKGNPKLLIIPVWFNDSDNFIIEEKKESVREDIQKAYVGSTTETGWNSVKSFYETESFNEITLDATVTDWYEIDKSYLDFAEESKVSETSNLVVKATDDYFEDHPSDSRTNYDSNSDGYLDGVMLIYGAPDCDALQNDAYKNLWAYCYWTADSSSRTTPKANVFFWASYDFLYGDNAFEKTGTSYASGYTENGIKIDTHCFIHEMGHVFGLEDYYDYSYHGYNPAGGFSMQDYNVGGHDPYSVMAYGWADPYVPDKTMTISIGDFQSTHDVILLANHSDIDSPFDEYLLLEYYTPTSLNKLDSTYSYRDSYPQGSSEAGIRLWHVDARLYSFLHYRFATNPYDGYVTHAMSNSYGGNHASPLGFLYHNYNILQLIRNDTNATYTPRDNFNESSLFKVGDSFDISTYSSQFVNGTNMNDGEELGWSFKVVSINETNAIISLTKIQ